MDRHQAGHARTLRIAGVATALSGLLLMVGGAAGVASADPSPHGTATGNKFVTPSGGGDTSGSGATSSGGTSSGGTSTGGVTSGGTGTSTGGVTSGGTGTSTGVGSALLDLSASANNGNNPHDTTTTSTTTPGGSTTTTTLDNGSKGIPNPDFVPDAPSTAQFVTVTTEDCNGIIPTPGSKKERKTLNPSFDSTLTGKAVIHWSVFPYQHPNGGADTLTVHDCVVAYPAGYLTAGTDFNADTGELLNLDPSLLKKNYTVLDKAELLDVTLTSHPQAEATFDYVWSSPASLPAGTVVCNYAKTTGNNSSGDTNRKGGGACVVIPGETTPTTTPTTLPRGGNTVIPPTTTTTVPVPTTAAVLPEVVTTTTVPTAVLPEVFTRTLPFTGTNSQLPLFAGVTLVILGLMLVAAARRGAIAQQ